MVKIRHIIEKIKTEIDTFEFRVLMVFVYIASMILCQYATIDEAKLTLLIIAIVSYYLAFYPSNKEQ